MAVTSENAADNLVKYSVFKHICINTNSALTSLNNFYLLSNKMSVDSDTVSNRSRDSFNESGYQEVKSSKRRAWVVAGSVTFVVLCTIMAVTLPAALKDEKTTPAASASTSFPTEAPDNFTTISMSRSTSSTKSSISTTTFSPEILATTNGDHEITTSESHETTSPSFAPTIIFEAATRETTSSLTETTISSTLSNANTTATLLRTTEEKTPAQSTTEIAASTTLVTPVLSTTTSYETTTVSVVERVDECEYINELLGVDICVLDARYPLNHCSKKNKGKKITWVFKKTD
jgi:hypothetical protein